MKYELAIFDMDGTILDSLNDLYVSVNYALKEASMPARTFDEVRQFVGNGVTKLIQRSVPAGTSEEDTEKVFNIFSDHYIVHCSDTTKPYDGIPEILAWLRENDVKTAVVSNKADPAVQELYKQYFDGQFDIAVGERPGIRKKPAPDAVITILNELGVDKSKAVYIGDSDVDVNTAKNAEMDCIAVAWGFRSVEFLKENGAETIVYNADELASLLK